MLRCAGRARSRPPYRQSTAIASRRIHGSGSYPLGPSASALASASVSEGDEPTRSA
jgi:hypothetical protein